MRTFAASSLLSSPAAARVARDAQLIIADGLCSRINELMTAATEPQLRLSAVADPLAAISSTLTTRRQAGAPVHTLHLVAHGRAGAFQIGDRWITAAALLSGADQLAQWQVAEIALWSCEAGADGDFIALLQELTGARVWASSTSLGRTSAGQQWQLTSSSHTTTAPVAPWAAEALQSWAHQLATYEFATAYQVTNVAGKESNFHTFNTSLPLGAVAIDDGTGGQKFSGNDVSASAVIIGGVTYYVWISRPIKVQGQVVGFYCWTDADFTTLAAAQADGNQDADGNTGDNIGFVLVVSGKESFFNGGSIGSSSDRVDTALNQLLPPPTPAPVAEPDSADGTPGEPGGAAVEAGVGPLGAIATVNATGNVLGNDAPLSGTKTVTFAGTTDANQGLGGTSTSVVGSYGTLQIFADGSYTYVVDNSNPEVDALLNNSLIDVFTYTMVDSQGRASTSTLSVTVLGSNDAPVAAPDYNSAKESLLTDGTEYTGVDPLGDLAIGNVLDNDTDVDAGDSKTIAGLSTSGNALGSATGSADTVLNFTASPNFNSIDAGDFVFLDDGAGNFTPLLDAGGVHLTVLSKDDVNTTLTLSGTPAITIANNTALGFNANPAAGPSTKQATVDSVTTGDPNLIDITGLFGTVAIGMSVGGTGLATDPVITAINYDANGLPISIVISQPLSGPLAGSLTFSASDNLAAGGFTLRGIYGVLVLQADGSYVYTPDADGPLNEGDIGTETFTYVMQDAAGVTDTATLTITVLGSSALDADGVDDFAGPINEKGGVSNGTATPPTDVTGLNVLSNDVNPDTGESSLLVVGISDLDTATFTPVDAGGTAFAGRYGTITIFADGSWSYVQSDDTPELQALNSGETLTEEFRYQVTNGVAGTNPDIASIFITINGANDAPVAEDDADSAVESGGSPSAPIDGFNPSGNVLDNDSDVDNTQAELSVTAVRTGSEAGTGTAGSVGTSFNGLYGSLLIRPDGTWDYTVSETNATVNELVEGESLVETFTYTVSDIGGLSDTAQLTITIDGSANGVDVDNVFVNEGSPYAVFTVSGQPGVTVQLNLDNAVTPAANLIDPDADLGSQLEIFNGVSWVPYVGGLTPIGPDGKLYVRVPVVNDGNDEGNESFTLTAITRDENAATGFGTINDEGEGDYWIGDNTAPATPVQLQQAGILLDDDRPMAVSNPNVNEGSPYAVFTVTGFSNQQVLLSLTGATGDSPTQDGPGGAADLGTPPPTIQYFDGISWVNYDPLNPPSIEDGGTTLLVRVSIAEEQEFDLDGPETFTLVATSTGGAVSTGGRATIVDNGTGDYFAADNTTGVPDQPPAGVFLDDDRLLRVSNVTVNEGSPYAVFTITGSENQRVVLTLEGANGDIPTENPQGAADLGSAPTIEYFNGSIWVEYDPLNPPAIAENATTLLVRVAIGNEQDAPLDGPETFTLVASNTGGSSFRGVGTILDDGNGAYFAQTNNSATSAIPAGVLLDDDRVMSVNNVTVNEGSPYAVFTVTGNNNQEVLLSLSGATGNGSPDLAGGAADLGGSPTIEYFDGAAWQTYNADTPPRISGTTLLVRIGIGGEQEPALDGPETFTLVARNTGGTASTGGVATIVDNGTGDYFAADNTTGVSTIPAGVLLDDDRALTITSVTVNEGSPYAVFTVTGNDDQQVLLSLSGNALAVPSPDGVQAYLGSPAPAIQVFNGVAWVDYNAANPPRIDGTTLLVRIAITAEQEAALDGPDTFTITATNTGGTGVNGVATIVDNGTGAYFAADNTTGVSNIPAGVLLDDDRTLTVSNVTVNEGSPYAVFTVTGNDDQQVLLSLSGANGQPLPPSADNPGGPANLGASPAIQYFNGTTWLNYNASTPPRIDGTTLLVRVAIGNEQEDAFDGPETFTLVATNTGGTASTGGLGTIKDDGTGSYWIGDNTDPATDAELEAAEIILDDDRTPQFIRLRPETDSTEIGNLITANGKPQIQIVGVLGRSDQLSLKGANGQTLILGDHYTVREVAFGDPYGRGIYVIDLIDADGDESNGLQPFGTYFQGQGTGNGANSLDGVYSVHYNGEEIDSFQIRTNPLSQAERVKCLTKIYGKAGDRSLESKLFGYRTEKLKGTNGDDNLLGTNSATGDTLSGKKGSDLLNGLGDRLAGGTVLATVAGQVDTLTGGKGRDFFQLGDTAGAYYLGGTSNAVITDFQKDDCLILHGEADDYVLSGVVGGARELRLGGDLIATIRGSGISGLNLGEANDVTFL